MRIEKIIVITIAAVLILCCITGTASARYASGGVENSGINLNDRVFIGEKNLDFSEFSNETCCVDYLMSLNPSSQIPLTNQRGSIPEGSASGSYGAYNNTHGRIGHTVCTIEVLNLGKLSVVPAGISASQIETNPRDISKNTGIIFYIDGSPTFLENQLSGTWNELKLKNDNTAETRSSIKNLAGIQQSLIGIEQPTSKTNQNYAFKFIDQNGFVKTSDVIPVTATFKVKLNGLEKEISYSFNAIDSLFELKETTIPAGTTGNTELTSVPFGPVRVYLENTDETAPYFIEGDGITITDKHTITAVPGWSGKILLPIRVPESAQSGSYRISASYQDNTISSFVKVPEGSSMKLIFERAPLDAVEGFFAAGDGIELKGTVSGASESIPIYLFIIGPGLPENGAKLEKELPGEVVDGDETTFSQTEYSPIFNEWRYIWHSGGFEPGTYTIYASLEPFGYKEVSNPSSIAYKKAVSHDYVISDQSITVKSGDKTSGYYTQGDPLVFEFVARGSPGSNGGLHGTVRWYILGQNFRYTDVAKDYELIKPDNYGKEAPPGNFTVKYERSFTQNLDPGTYTLIVQHPGPNMVFDVEPDNDVGRLALLTTSGGITSNIGDLQVKNAVYALTELISNPKSDDLYVVTEIIIERPSIKINKLENVCIGDEIKISGTTNYQSENEFSVKINKINFDSPESNIAMIVTTERIKPLSQTPYSKFMERTFISEAIDTSTWFPGSYEAKITNIDTGFEETMRFDLIPQKSESGDYIGEPYTDPSLTTYQTPAPTLPPTSTPHPTPTKSPGFAVVLPALFAGFAYMFRRR